MEPQRVQRVSPGRGCSPLTIIQHETRAVPTPTREGFGERQGTSLWDPCALASRPVTATPARPQSRGQTHRPSPRITAVGIFSGPRAPFFGAQGTWPGPAPGVFLCPKPSAEGRCSPILGVGSFCPCPQEAASDPAAERGRAGLGAPAPCPAGHAAPSGPRLPPGLPALRTQSDCPFSPRGRHKSPGFPQPLGEKAGCSEPGTGMESLSTCSRPRKAHSRLVGPVQTDRPRPREAAPSHPAQDGYLASA